MIYAVADQDVASRNGVILQNNAFGTIVGAVICQLKHCRGFCMILRRQVEAHCHAISDVDVDNLPRRDASHFAPGACVERVGRHHFEKAISEYQCHVL